MRERPTGGPIRLLTPADLPRCMALKDEAGWNQTVADWLKLLRIAPEGCFGIDCEDTLAATTTAVSYGAAFAWIGMVLTGAPFRRRGFASALIHHAIAHCERQHVGWIGLDATDQGRPVYERAGFIAQRPIERWLRAGSAAPRQFEPECFRSGGAVAHARPGSRAAYFGPCRGDDIAAVRQMLHEFLKRHVDEPVMWDLFPENEHAVDLAHAYAFAPVRRLTRMTRAVAGGPAGAGIDIVRTYAIAGFELG